MSLKGRKQLCQVLVQVLLNFVFYIASTSASIVHPLGWGAISSQGSESHLSILSVDSSNSTVPIYTPRGREALRESNVLARTKYHSI